ncbi:acyltransferase [Polluticoccus soli]|uniref:acyltransferase n=1 Tax=Polluticoccus soli TaxID=3034150 RepID=UPI0023E2300D|nr:acyltransferase [Flavipsychrobacter sp. JY13-12]
MQKLDISKFDKGRVGANVEIFCDEFISAGGFTLGDNVCVKARKIVLGHNARVENDVTIRSMRGDMELFCMGDESLLGFNTQVLVPEFRMGDYSQIFNSALVSGYKPVKMGHNCWIGQGAILNSADILTIGNNVRMGGSQIWTHVASGELLEGSNFYNVAPVIIEDNVWLMGFGHTVVPGITLAQNSVIMAGSVVTKSTEPFKTYSGIPAADVSDKLPAWQELTLDDKFGKLREFTAEFLQAYPQYETHVHCIDDERDEIIGNPNGDTPCLLFLKQAKLDSHMDGIHSVFDLSSKKYIKRRNQIEIDWIKFALGYRARFIPFN